MPAVCVACHLSGNTHLPWWQQGRTTRARGGLCISVSHAPTDALANILRKNSVSPPPPVELTTLYNCKHLIMLSSFYICHTSIDPLFFIFNGGCCPLWLTAWLSSWCYLFFINKIHEKNMYLIPLVCFNLFYFPGLAPFCLRASAISAHPLAPKPSVTSKAVFPVHFPPVAFTLTFILRSAKSARGVTEIREVRMERDK